MFRHTLSLAARSAMKLPTIGKIPTFLLIFTIGLWYAPLSWGWILGYIIGVALQDKDQPAGWPLPPTTRYGALGLMIGFGLVGVNLGIPIVPLIEPSPPPIIIDGQAGRVIQGPPPASPDITLRTIYFACTSLAFGLLLLWQHYQKAAQRELTRHGSARFATKEDLRPYLYQADQASFYLGGGQYAYPRNGHFLTVAGTRSGKGVNLVVPNLLGGSKGKLSWLVIDPKGELAAITAPYLKSQGKTVYILNPWELLGLNNDHFNPLDLLADHTSKNLADDAQLLATMLIPKSAKEDSHWDKKSRSLLAGIMMHLGTVSHKPDSPHELSLGYIWRILNSSQDDWLAFLAEMALNEHPISGYIIAGVANSTLSLMATSEKEAASIFSSLSGWIDVFKSNHLQESLRQSAFDMNCLADGNTVVFVNIPADKLKSHFTWLRLVVTTFMKAVVRNPNERVVFCLDEFYALGYLDEIQVALGTYAGYGISVWCILQSLVQLQSLYGKNWENFIGNSAVIHAFGLNDHTTAEYFSKMAGTTSIPSYHNERPFGRPQSSTGRPLISSDEARRLDDEMLVFIDNLPPARLPKVPYYSHPVWSKRARPNPYYKG